MTHLTSGELAGIEARWEAQDGQQFTFNYGHWADEVVGKLLAHIRALSASPVVTDAMVEAARAVIHAYYRENGERFSPGDPSLQSGAIRAALEAALPALGKGVWQTMDTAPPYQKIWIWDGADVFLGNYDGKHWRYWDDERLCNPPPMKWQPSAEPPAQPEQE
jgi:hypothetical protein